MLVTSNGGTSEREASLAWTPSLLNRLSIDPRYITALLLTPNHRSEYALMVDILAAWKAKVQRQKSLQDLETAAHQFLAQAALQRGQTPVLIIDEASLMRLEVFAQIHTLSQFDMDSKPLLPIVLAGQNNLVDKLMFHTSRPLASRRSVVTDRLGP